MAQTLDRPSFVAILTAALHAHYEPGDPVLHLICAACEAAVLHIAVAPGQVN